MLFVCTANVTRSPAAAAIFADLASKSGEKWEVASAGVRAGKGFPANSIISFLMYQRKIPVSSHRSQPIDPKLFARYHWIMVMESAHREAIIQRYPEIEPRVACLRTFGLSDQSIPTDFPDPTGKNPDDYRELFALLDAEIPRVFRLIRQKIDDIEMKPEI